MLEIGRKYFSTHFVHFGPKVATFVYFCQHKKNWQFLAGFVHFWPFFSILGHCIYCLYLWDYFDHLGTPKWQFLAIFAHLFRHIAWAVYNVDIFLNQHITLLQVILL